MRSRTFTLALLMLAALLGGLLWLHLRDGNLDSLLGAPPVPVGERIYNSFSPQDVHHIRIEARDAKAAFELTPSGWQATSPWQDRMDPRAALGIIQSTLGLVVQDVAPIDKVTPKESGFAANSIHIRLTNAEGKSLADYRIGRKSAWQMEGRDGADPMPTAYIQPRDPHRKDHIYLAAGDIAPIFRDNLRLLRDHRPFYFNPLALSHIRIRNKQGEILLGRSDASSPWRIEKPLALASNTATVKTLIESLYELTASRLLDTGEVTLPAANPGSPGTQIALGSFGIQDETVLSISPATSGATTCYATVSDRPGTIFALPLQSSGGGVTLASLPLALNELRDRSITRLNVAAIRGIAIQPATSETIILTRPPKKPWMASVGNARFEANESLVFTLLKAITTQQVLGFESDAATDLTPWGLDRPFLRLIFAGESESAALELGFGMNERGEIFANRPGSPTVMRVSRSLIDAISIRPYEWQLARLWSLDRNNLTTIRLAYPGKPELILGYNFFTDEWTAKVGDVDATTRLVPSKANYLLTNIEGLQVDRWLPPGDPAATSAIQKHPFLTLTTTEDIKDDDDQVVSTTTRTLTLASVTSGPDFGNCYGITDTNPCPFILSSEVVKKITAPLLEGK